MAEPVDTTRLRDLLTNAAPRPWQSENLNDGDPPEYGPLWGVTNDAFHNPGTDDDGPWLAIELHVGVREDTELIAEAINALAALLDELDQLRAEVNRPPCVDVCGIGGCRGACGRQRSKEATDAG